METAEVKQIIEAGIKDSEAIVTADGNKYTAIVISDEFEGKTMLAEATYPPGTLGNEKSQVEVDFYVIPKTTMNLTAMSYCTKHGLWQSEPFEVKVD